MQKSTNKAIFISSLVAIAFVLGGLTWRYYLLPAKRLAYVDSAIVTLRIVFTAEKQFVETHPQQGYACAFSQLSLRELELPNDFSISGQRNGYAFEIKCIGREHRDSDFQVTARPLEQGMAAFCVDRSGVVKYDASGSTDRCLAKGTGL